MIALSRAIFSCCFCLLAVSSFKSHAQHGPLKVRQFKSKIDSIRLAGIEAQLDMAYTQRPLMMRRIDSLASLQLELYRNAVIYRNIYRPGPGFITTDSLQMLDDLSGIRKVSVVGKSAIPDIVWKCDDLESLELINTSIDRIPERLDDLPKLTRLLIYNNRIERPLKLPRSTRITHLTILNERPDGLPKSYRKFRALQILDLSENGLEKFPNGAHRNRQLRELSLQRNKLTLQNRIKTHRRLERLSLHENNINRVPRSIKNLKNLERLNFNANEITRVSPAIARLKRLEHLSFYRNRLTEVPKGVYRLRGLRSIDLFHNEISRLEPVVANWTLLELLYVSHNKLVALPENIDALTQLTGLYAWDNRLEKLPESIGNMTNLRVVRVNKNYLHALPASFLRLSNLQEVDLSHNYISYLPEALFLFRDLTILAVTGNRFDNATRALIERVVGPLRQRGVFVHLSDE